MEVIRVTGLACHYGARTIFEDVDLVVRSRDRVALVGPNGAGKSSLLRMLAGIAAPDGGTVVRARDASIGYLAQGVSDETETTLEQLIDSALGRIPDTEWTYARKRLLGMLHLFGFEPVDFARPLASFSGGQRAKAALAHLLIDAPDVLILDEPTNHLDIATVRWLESYIAQDSRTYVIVSHDRYFLDRAATRVVELDAGALHAYPPERPAYTRYVARRDERLAQEREAYRVAVEERDRRRATIAGLRATHTSSDYSQVRSRERQLQRLERASLVPERVTDVPSIALSIASDRRPTAGFALEAEGLCKRYDAVLFSGVTFDLQQRDRLAIVGRNGSGKSTMLRVLSGEIAPDAGTVRYNPAVRRAYFAQSVQDQLDVEATAVDAVMALGARTPEEARGYLGRLRISGDAGERRVSSFSGGERRRIVLAGLMAQRPDVLLLDEPTNDLDIASREALEAVLAEFDGAIVAISHDRYLLDRLARRVLWIDGGAWGIVDSWAEYESREHEREPAGSRASAPPRETARLTPLKQKTQAANRLARAERAVEKLDARRTEIDALFAEPATYDDRARVKTLEEEAAALTELQSAALREWESALHDVEGLE